jgi:GNAT superfamily N-acetyltransferase
VIRFARPADIPQLLDLIHGLAAYEKEPDAVEATAADLRAALFGPDSVAGCFVATTGNHPNSDTKGDDAVVGLALWFRTFSTWTGRTGIWLEDLYVADGHRRSGHGRDLLAALAALCVERGWPRLEWTVLDWNSDAIAFYRSVGAVGQDAWTTQRVDGAALTALAAGTDAVVS